MQEALPTSISLIDITHSQLKMAQAMNEEDTVPLNLDDVNDDLASEVTISTQRGNSIYVLIS